MHQNGCCFVQAVTEIFRRPLGPSEIVKLRRFKALFGVSPAVCFYLWVLLTDKIPQKCMPKHFLWACLHLKSYANETFLCALTGTDEKTQRFFVWTIIKCLARLCIVRLSILFNFFINFM